MNKTLVVFFLLITAPNAARGEPIGANAWRALEKYDVRTLAQTFDSQAGKLVAVRFNFRGKDIHHIKPSWYEGSIWQPDPQRRKGFSNVRVMVSKQDLPAFKSITSDFTASAPLLVYGWVRRDWAANFTFVQLLGRKTTLDSAGNAIVSW